MNENATRPGDLPATVVQANASSIETVPVPVSVPVSDPEPSAPVISYVTPDAMLPSGNVLVVLLGLSCILLGLLAAVFYTLNWNFHRKAFEDVPVQTEEWTPIAAPIDPPYTGDTIGARGLPAGVRTKLLAQLQFEGKYRDDCREMLNIVLADQGKWIVGDAVPQWPATWPRTIYCDGESSHEIPGGLITLSPESATLGRENEIALFYTWQTVRQNVKGPLLRYHGVAIDRSIAGLKRAGYLPNEPMTRAVAHLLSTHTNPQPGIHRPMPIPIAVTPRDAGKGMLELKFSNGSRSVVLPSGSILPQAAMAEMGYHSEIDTVHNRYRWALWDPAPSFATIENYRSRPYLAAAGAVAGMVMVAGGVLLMWRRQAATALIVLSTSVLLTLPLVLLLLINVVHATSAWQKFYNVPDFYRFGYQTTFAIYILSILILAQTLTMLFIARELRRRGLALSLVPHSVRQRARVAHRQFPAAMHFTARMAKIGITLLILALVLSVASVSAHMIYGSAMGLVVAYGVLTLSRPPSFVGREG